MTITPGSIVTYRVPHKRPRTARVLAIRPGGVLDVMWAGRFAFVPVEAVRKVRLP